ncbi:NADP-dependent oxidoreductase [Actinoplanes sp. KI2]|uniref:NADP-dependent oxidoreductase n=1 Tax=Actinoplanes sp. KI2 TaxID=2983315 RepID=UPI0021D5E1E6|nr:NADP-dependent oxidoreductase [Actinoplanes sp. KI2]MCU7726606.1 NADP-dependent oxidoreductase [Actinoplanes sp. KI2]
MRTLRFHEYGDPAQVLRLEEAAAPEPGPGQIRVAVEACGLTPADWALCGGLFAGELPRGIGLEVAGTVDALGAGVSGVAAGDPVFGPAPFRGPTAGAAELAVLDVWFARPAGLGPAQAAGLPMAVETAYRGLADLGVTAGTTLLVSGAGTTVGFAAVQIAIGLGARVIATAGPTYAGDLRDRGAEVTGYGEGLADRVTAIAGGPVDVVLDLAPAGTALPELVRTVAAPTDVLTQSDLAGAGRYGVRVSAGAIRDDVLGEYAELAAAGRFSVPIAGVHPLDEWRAALYRSRSGQAHGKLVLQIG